MENDNNDLDIRPKTTPAKGQPARGTAAKPKTEAEGGAVAAEAPAPLLKYEVLCKELKIGGVLAYQTARVNLTKEQADAIESAQPGSLKFAGI